MSEIRTAGDKDALARVWRRIVDELAHLQAQSPEELRGHVVNSISGQVYYRDTAFGARVFATEYELTGLLDWRHRAEAALSALLALDLFTGLEEPLWNRYGWHSKRGSLSATAMSLDALWMTIEQLGVEQEIGEWDRLMDYLERCMMRPGLFAHDAIQPGMDPVPVQNTTAMALLLMEHMASKRVDHDINQRMLEGYLRETRRAVYRGQRNDGFWPYLHPEVIPGVVCGFVPLGFLVKRSSWLRNEAMRRWSRTWLQVDGIHNGYVLYFLARSLLIRGNIGQEDRKAVALGWDAIRGQLIGQPNGSVLYDFSDEPQPDSPRYCSFFSTTVYFLVLAILPMLEKLGLSEPECVELGEGIVRHIEGDLLEEPGIYPCIQPNEGPQEFLRSILPHVGESVAFRGACLSEWMLHRAQRTSGN